MNRRIALFQICGDLDGNQQHVGDHPWFCWSACCWRFDWRWGASAFVI